MPLQHDYHPGDHFHYHIWKRLKVGDIVRVKCNKKKLLVTAKVIECIGTDRYKLEAISKIHLV
jgi:hypothetical protein